MPPEFRALMERYCQLGRLLPSLDDMETAIENTRTRAQAKLVLDEMAKTKRQIDQFMLRHGRLARSREMQTP